MTVNLCVSQHLAVHQVQREDVSPRPQLAQLLPRQRPHLWLHPSRWHHPLLQWSDVNQVPLAPWRSPDSDPPRALDLRSDPHTGRSVRPRQLTRARPSRHLHAARFLPRTSKVSEDRLPPATASSDDESSSLLQQRWDQPLDWVPALHEQLQAMDQLQALQKVWPLELCHQP